MPQLTHKHTTPIPRANTIERAGDEAQLAIMAALEAAGIEVIEYDEDELEPEYVARFYK